MLRGLRQCFVPLQMLFPFLKVAIFFRIVPIDALSSLSNEQMRDVVRKRHANVISTFQNREFPQHRRKF